MYYFSSKTSAPENNAHDLLEMKNMCRRYEVNNAFILSISNKSQDEKVSISGKKTDIYIYIYI